MKGMRTAEALSVIYAYLGTLPFRVRDMPRHAVAELLAVADVRPLSPDGVGTTTGRWLNEAAAGDARVASGVAELVVLEPADGPKPGLYQFAAGD